MRSFARLILGLTMLMPAAHAVIVRGKVTSSLGVPLPGARVQLIQGPRSVAASITGPDGAYEIRIDLAGRFLLLTAPSAVVPGYAPQVGTPFYAGRSDLITIDIALNHATVTPRLSAQPTLLQTPVDRLPAPLTQLSSHSLLTLPSPIPELQTSPSAMLLQPGQTGSPAFLYLRGAPPQTLHASIDSVPANDVGGSFNLSTISSSGLSAIDPRSAVELSPLANPLYFVGSSGGLLTFNSAEAQSQRVTLTYTGDAGNLDALRNEAVVAYAHNRLDLLGSFSRFDLANSIPAAPYHLVAWNANVGYHISAGTSLRFTGREDVSAAPLSSPYELFLVTPDGREAHQNIFASATFETRTARNWHNLVQYGLARRRAQTFDYVTPATGLPVSIHGANGYIVSGIATFVPLPSREDAITDRDEGTYQTDYRIKPWLNLLGEFRYQDERAADVLPTEKRTLTRNHVSVAIGLQGGFRERFFYEASGFFDHTQPLGFTGAPRLGLTYVPVRPGTRKFRGTSLHLTVATGVREPSLLEQAATANTPASPRTRMLDASVDQNLLSQKLILRGGYFHSQFSHEFEPIALSAIGSQPILSQTLALRTQGLESQLSCQPFPRVSLQAGYSYLASLTEQSAVTPTFNPAFPANPIGALSALAGQRPFHRPPQSVFFAAEYSGQRLNAAIKGSSVSRSDDSTNLLQSPNLLLPNRNLSPAYTSLDAHASLAFTRHITVFTQLTNLTNDRHIAPIGYLSTPFLIQTGLRIRLGSE